MAKKKYKWTRNSLRGRLMGVKANLKAINKEAKLLTPIEATNLQAVENMLAATLYNWSDHG